MVKRGHCTQLTNDGQWSVSPACHVKSLVHVQQILPGRWTRVHPIVHSYRILSCIPLRVRHHELSKLLCFTHPFIVLSERGLESSRASGVEERRTDLVRAKVRG